jgi:hypothetical protein
MMACWDYYISVGHDHQERTSHTTPIKRLLRFKGDDSPARKRCSKNQHRDRQRRRVSSTPVYSLLSMYRHDCRIQK